MKSNLQRKFGSSSSEGDSFVANLDPELRRKLEAMESDTKKQETEIETASSASSSSTTPVTAQAQAERAARICDIIVEGREK